MPHDLILTPHLDDQRAAQLTPLVEYLDWQLDHPTGTPQPVAQSGLLEQLGTFLWEATRLDVDTVRAALDAAREAERPLRFVVQGEHWQHLPWELLYHPHPELGFVARHPWCVVGRRLRGTGELQPRLLPRPLRLLLFIASPEDLDPERSRLDFEREEELLYTALDRPLARGEVEIDVAEDGVFATLLARLEEQRYHAVILSMHGTSARDSQGTETWGLLFEHARTGRSAPVAGSDLAAQLDRLPRGHRPGLVVLAACRSARAAESAKSLSSVAAMLHTVGVERVLGMRLSVLDGAASAFDAELFRRLALGEEVGRAVTLARQAVVEDTWWQALPGQDRSRGDPWAQWSLPVLLDRTQDGPLMDMDSAATPLSPRSHPTLLIGDGTVHLPERQAFIGRRKEKRQYLRAFLEGETRGRLFMGPGGVGKTSLAGLFARILGERYPETRLLGFRAPFVLDTLYEPLRREAFDGMEEPSLLAAIQAEPDLRERLRRLLRSLAQRRDRPCAFVLDNLEAIQDLASLKVAAEHADSLWFLREVCALPAPTRMLLTGRYALNDLPDGVVRLCPLPDASYGDVLRRMQRLAWPPSLSAAEKRHIYSVLGGNHRAVEWAGQVLKQEHQQTAELVAALVALHAPPETPEEVVQVVVEAMRQNLLFARLRSLLTSTQDRLLRAASLYRVPVNEDGLLALTDQPAQAAEDWQRLATYSLLERGHDPELALDYWLVPPVVRELMHDHGFSPSELQALHRAMGRYHRFQGEYVSRRWSDGVEAIYHFRQAGEHTAADEMAKAVSAFYYHISNYTEARALTEEIVHRASPSPPCWALNYYGLCQLVLGFPDSALAAFNRALPIAATSVEKSVTLTNLGQIYQARGDYDTALRYLEASLTICREISHKVGEGMTLHNLGEIYRAREDYDTALRYLEASLAIYREIGYKAGEAATLINLGATYQERGDYDTALRYLEASLAICREIDAKADLMKTLYIMGLIAWATKNRVRARTLLSEAFDIARETQNGEGLFNTASTFGLRLVQIGAEPEARPFLQLAVQVGKAAGFAYAQEVEAVLLRLSSDRS